jgi:uncharacterized protein
MDNMDTLRYDRWIEDALKSVVRKALHYCQENGLPGDHHFYITFSTDHPDAVVPEHLRAQYPQEITIVLENEFWDLKVDEKFFDVTLSFSDIKTPLHIPFEAITGFADPSVKFGLQFKMELLEDDDDYDDEIDSLDIAPQSETKPADANKDNVVTLDAFRKK